MQKVFVFRQKFYFNDEYLFKTKQKKNVCQITFCALMNVNLFNISSRTLIKEFNFV